MNEALTWEAMSARWPNSAASRFVETPTTRWHVQVMGEGPVALLLHGTGAASHSWGALAPILAKNWRVVAPDLPGHGFTPANSDRLLTVHGMSAALGELLRALGLSPSIVVGHSAGAAVMLRMSLDGQLSSANRLVGINAALSASSPLLRLLAAPLGPVAQSLGGWLGGTEWFPRELLASTGSAIGEEQRRLYAAFLASPRHIEALWTMMSQWDLEPLLRDVGALSAAVTLIAGEKDAWVDPSVSEGIATRIPRATVVRMPGVGHLAHEEDPARVAALIAEAA